jgi:hypothetical protein
MVKIAHSGELSVLVSLGSVCAHSPAAVHAGEKDFQVEGLIGACHAFLGGNRRGTYLLPIS